MGNGVLPLMVAAFYQSHYDHAQVSWPSTRRFVVGVMYSQEVGPVAATGGLD